MFLSLTVSATSPVNESLPAPTKSIQTPFFYNMEVTMLEPEILC